MRVVILGRSEAMYDTAIHLRSHGHDIAAIITAKGAPEYSRQAGDFEELAAQWGVPYFYAPRLTGDDIQRLAAEADIGVSVNYSSIIPSDVIGAFPLGILNAHGGDLPRYRGNACQAWAILNGERRIGLCIHRMVGGEVDAGDIVAREYMPVSGDTRIGDVVSWIGQRIPPLFETSLSHLQQDPSYVLERQSKNPQDALRCYPRLPEDGLLDWKQPATALQRLVNASSEPYEGAFCTLNGQKMIVWRAALADDDERFLAVPGQVIAIDEEGCITVAAGEGKLRVTECQIGDRRGVPGLFIRSLRVRLR